MAVSERRACRTLSQPRGTQRYEPRRIETDKPLIEAMKDLSRRHPRYGYRRITALLRADGWPVNRKRVHRLWRQEGLKVPGNSGNVGGWVLRKTVARVGGPSMSTTYGHMIF